MGTREYIKILSDKKRIKEVGHNIVRAYVEMKYIFNQTKNIFLRTLNLWDVQKTKFKMTEK